MSRGVVWGVGKGLNGQEAGRLAAQNALQWVSNSRPALGIVFVSQEFEIGETLSGLGDVLTNVPLWGFSTVMPWSSEGEQPRSVVLALITGSDFKALVNLYPNFAQDGQAVARQILRGMKGGSNAAIHTNGLLLAVEGVNGDITQVTEAINEIDLRMVGGLASGSYQTGKTYLVGGNQSASGAISALQLGGRLRLALGLGHGWKPIGRRFRVSRARSLWVNALDGASPVEAYAALFGHDPRQWAFPPLNELVRQYPLGIEKSADDQTLQICSPMRVEVDGRFRMSSPVPEGLTAHLMVGDPSACLEATRAAVRSARELLGEAKPLLAIAFIDLAWLTLFQNRPGQVADALRSELGDIPLVGAYTLGQLARPVADQPLQVLNQHIVVALIGEVEK